MTLSEKYRIVQRLGNQQKRKFSEVFLVADEATGQKGTLKFLTKTPDNAALQERLRAEADFQFTHTGLPQTLFLQETETELAIVRSYAEGVPLDSFLKQVKQKQKPSVLLRFLEELAPLLHALRQENVVHLDLKPSNLILNGSPAAFTVSLIDFGMALRTDRPENRGTLFPLGYAAPELLLNRLPLVDQRTDLFALGVVLWQQFTGRLPLVHPNPSITTNLQLTHPLPQYDAIPKAIFAILERMCAKHAFGVPPNQLAPGKMDESLKEAMNRRYNDIDEVTGDWRKALEDRKPFWQIFR